MPAAPGSERCHFQVAQRLDARILELCKPVVGCWKKKVISKARPDVWEDVTSPRLTWLAESGHVAGHGGDLVGDYVNP